MRKFTNSFIKFLKRMWPQAPFGLLLIFIGASNILMEALKTQGNNTIYQVLAHVVSISELSREVSLGILGSGVQALLGGVMLITGIGLFWRLRSAWAFSVILLLITVAVEFFSQRSLYVMLLPGLALIALIIWQSRFDHLSLVGSYLMSFIGVLAVFTYGVFGSYLLGNEFHPVIHDLSTSLYFTVVTLSTVGSNIYPASPEAQLFMVSLILGGISIFTTTIVSTARPLLSKQFKANLTGRRTDKKLNAHIILVGDSPFANSAANELTRKNIPFVQVATPKGSPVAEVQSPEQVNPDEEAQLKQAEIISAKMVLIACTDAAKNASLVATAKKLNPKVRVAVAANTLEAIPELKSLQADLVFTPETAGGRLLTDMLLGIPFPKDLQELLELGSPEA